MGFDHPHLPDTLAKSEDDCTHPRAQMKLKKKKKERETADCALKKKKSVI